MERQRLTTALEWGLLLPVLPLLPRRGCCRMKGGAALVALPLLIPAMNFCPLSLSLD